MPAISPVSDEEKLSVARLAWWFAASRLAFFLVALGSLKIVPPGPYPISHGLLGLLDRWDAGWYLSIVRHGYYYRSDGQSSVAFFPLYPLLVHLLSFIVPSQRAAGYLVSSGFLFGSCLMLWKIAARQYASRALADWAVLFLLLCPVTMFYSSIYTESLFLFLLLAAAWSAGERRWLAAGACGYLAALTRSPGILVSVLIVAEYATLFIQNRQGKSAPMTWGETIRAAAGVVLPGAGLITYAIYLHFKVGDALAFIHAEAFWNCHLAGFWHVFSAADRLDIYAKIWHFGSLLLCLALAVLAFRFRLRPSHLAIMVAFLFLYCSFDSVMSMPRFLSVVFPFYLVEAAIAVRWPRVGYGFLGIGTVLAVVALIQFVDGYGF